MSIQISIEKEKQWDEIAERASRITDKLGMPIDQGILETVIVLNLLGITTKQSCEGHMDHGIPAPWIFFTTPGIDEIPDYQGVMQKHVKDQQKVLALLDTFYADRHVSQSVRLFVYPRNPGISNLESQGARCQYIASPEARALKLREYQEEMLAFTAFLKELFFGCSNCGNCGIDGLPPGEKFARYKVY
ncbi:MAG TPA: hypothetical protein VGL94_06245 [Ktedonobacteraceae bacterium]|jgi:hypothetical protein